MFICRRNLKSTGPGKDSNMTMQPEYPLYVLNKATREFARFDEAEHLETNIEFLDTEDQEDCDYLVLDAHFRRVKLILEYLEVKEIALKEKSPRQEDVDLLNSSNEVGTP